MSQVSKLRSYNKILPGPANFLDIILSQQALAADLFELSREYVVGGYSVRINRMGTRYT